MRIAVIGQAAFGVDVYRAVRANGHQVVGVFTVPDKNGKEDPLAQAAHTDNVPCFKFAAWRRKGVCIDECFTQYKSVNAELNILPFCTQFIPMEVIEYPSHKTIIYHPSLLPRHRGASAINWTLMHGDVRAGFTIFWADDGLDTGPILLQRGCDVEENDTLNTLYKRYLYPEGVKGMVGERVRAVGRTSCMQADAVQMIAAGNAPRIVQPTEGATYEAYITAKPELAQINFSEHTAQSLHNFIRGNDKVPGAWALLNGEQHTFFASTLHKVRVMVWSLHETP